MAALLVLAGAAGCSEEVPRSQGLSGSVVVDGSSTVTPLLRAVADRLVADVEPGVTVELTTSGTGAGMERLCAGEADLAMASREISDEEAAACEAAGVETVEVPVGLDAVTVVVPRRNDFVGCLSLPELAGLWSDGSVRTWRDVREEWPATALVLFSPGPGSGTTASFAEAVLGGEAVDGEDQREDQREDVATSEDDEVIVDGVATSPGGVGYVPLGYARAAQDDVRPVAVDGGDGCVEPDEGTVTDGTYPMTRPLRVYVSAEAYRTRPPVAALVALLVADGADAAEDALVVPPTPQQQDEAAAALEQLGPGPG